MALSKRDRQKALAEARGVLNDLFQGGHYMPNSKELAQACPFKTGDTARQDIWSRQVKQWKLETDKLLAWDGEKGLPQSHFTGVTQ